MFQLIYSTYHTNTMVHSAFERTRSSSAIKIAFLREILSPSYLIKFPWFYGAFYSDDSIRFPYALN